MVIRHNNVINLLQESLNFVDTRLVDHGKRVAYLIYKVLRRKKKYAAKELQNFCVLALLHDIGAYKTEEIDRMVIFETIDVWEHSVYGYLFLKYFSPINDLADVILFHHASCEEAAGLSPAHRELAQLISLCDRADVYTHHSKNIAGFYQYIEEQRDIKFSSESINDFILAGIDLYNINEEIELDKEFDRLIFHNPLTKDEINKFIQMVIFSIDFRSSQTVIHTVAVTSIAGTIARLTGMNGGEIEKITAGAMLHDIGKISTPVNILESTGKLNAAEMEIMRGHVNVTEQILRGNVDDDVVDIALHHHEKINGTGYPNRLGDSDITRYDRIVSVADIMGALVYSRSYKNEYPKEKVIDILNDMSDNNLIDEKITQAAVENYDLIIEEAKNTSRPVVESYLKIQEEYIEIKKNLNNVQSCRALFA